MSCSEKNYHQIANSIDYLVEHYLEQPSLKTLAKVSDLSPAYFQRCFTSLVGISPKALLQQISFNHAKQLLNIGETVFDTTFDTGLSSPARLHDLCIKLKAATPGEIKSQGHGLAIEYGFGFSPFGQCFIAQSTRGVMELRFVGNDEVESMATVFRQSWPKADFSHDNTQAQTLLNTIFNFNIKQTTLTAYVKASRFQLQVWKALLEVKPTELVSYSLIAKKINKPKAHRAVGSAVAKNPLAYLIPCHRVIQANGIIGNYRWDRLRKRIMLLKENGLKIER